MPKRRTTFAVRVGEIPLGGPHPIRVQSMTTTDTMDTAGTVAQIERLVAAGSEYVRLTVPSPRDAENLKVIRAAMHRQKINIPLIADIHFHPRAALIAADYVEKVRINPGNYADRKTLRVKEYSDAQYTEALERVFDVFRPLVLKCRNQGVAMRIGVNHGSLSDRIMNRFGDTPLGMVQSAIEFIEMAEVESYKALVLSMKSSIPSVMIEAYRLLVRELDQRGMHYPIHLGVTEAGEGTAGRIKSALGIGTLLMEGIGDTVRVSLTESPEHEIPVARRLIQMAARSVPHPSGKFPVVCNLPLDETPKVPLVLSGPETLDPVPDGHILETSGNKGDPALILRLLGNPELLLAQPVDFPVFLGKIPASFPATSPHGLMLDLDDSPSQWEEVMLGVTTFLVLCGRPGTLASSTREIARQFSEKGLNPALVLVLRLDGSTPENGMLEAAVTLGGLLMDGFGCAIMIEHAGLPASLTTEWGFQILQAARLRLTRTEYISCPSCGRTLFDLEETSRRIREATIHLKGLKIGIMGCIVNGPGEMADADYGYVGAGPGKITLYRGKEVIKKNVPAEDAVEQLIELIRGDGRWLEPASGAAIYSSSSTV